MIVDGERKKLIAQLAHPISVALDVRSVIAAATAQAVPVALLEAVAPCIDGGRCTGSRQQQQLLSQHPADCGGPDRCCWHG